MQETPVLIILGGLPGSGKTSIARALARRLPAQHLRIDTIEETLRRERPEIEDQRDTGYQIAYALAEDNLKLGQSMIGDSVNPIELCRTAWRDVARRAGRPFLEVEIFCSDRDIHRNRVERRRLAAPTERLPGWNDVLRRHYEPWAEATLRIDTVHSSPEECAERIAAAIHGKGVSWPD